MTTFCPLLFFQNYQACLLKRYSANFLSIFPQYMHGGSDVKMIIYVNMFQHNGSIVILLSISAVSTHLLGNTSERRMWGAPCAVTRHCSDLHADHSFITSTVTSCRFINHTGKFLFINNYLWRIFFIWNAEGGHKDIKKGTTNQTSMFHHIYLCCLYLSGYGEIFVLP